MDIKDQNYILELKNKILEREKAQLIKENLELKAQLIDALRHKEIYRKNLVAAGSVDIRA
jgi:hypothetical protein